MLNDLFARLDKLKEEKTAKFTEKGSVEACVNNMSVNINKLVSPCYDMVTVTMSLIPRLIICTLFTLISGYLNRNVALYNRYGKRAYNIMLALYYVSTILYYVSTLLYYVSTILNYVSTILY